MNALALVVLASSAVLSLQKALDSCADWTMERTLAGGGRTLVSVGDVRCKAGESIVWTVKSPFESSVAMATNAMVFVDEDGRREKSLDELPHYEDIRRATDAFAAGNTNAFNGVFEIRETELPSGGWRLEFRPEVSAMRRLFTSIEVTGAALPTNAVMHNGDGGTSVIRFREKGRDR